MKAAGEPLEHASQALPVHYESFELRADRPRSLCAPSRRDCEAYRVGLLTLSQQLRELAARTGRTPFSALLGALVALLYRYSGETDFTIGVRTPGSPVRPFHCDVACDPTFTELLGRTSASDSETEASRVAELESLAPRLAICVTHASAPLPPNELPIDLHFIATQSTGGWTLACEYDANLFERDTIRVLFATLDALLAGIGADPETPLSQMPLVSGSERERLVVAANATRVPYPAERTIAELIAEHVLRTPAAVAVVCGERTLTYAQLDAASNRLARELLARDLGYGKRVGVFIERSVDLVVALLAVLKAGSTYVPLDPEYPRERLGFIARDAMLAAVISRATLNHRLRADAPFVNLDTDAMTIERRSAEPIELERTTAAAYIVYTSGSTGKPKGVAVSQPSLVNVVCALAAADAFDITVRDVNVAVATISFDVATLDVFLPLSRGARLVVATEFEAADGGALYALLQRSRATFIQATPLTFELLLEAGWCGEPRLKIHCGGDAISRTLADRLLAHGNELWNGYGPTETTITSSIARVGHDAGPVLMGPPIANTQFYVLDRVGQLVPPGVAGELYIGGAGVSLGYYGRPDLTRERFLPDAFGQAAEGDAPSARVYRTGDIVRRRGEETFEFLGRIDDQVKIRGFRIELGEIEAALLRQAEVCEAVAVVRGSAADEKTLCAFVVAAANARERGDSWPARLRSSLSETLPHYMVPAAIVVIDALPRTPTGKVDRRALSVPERGAAPAVADSPPNPIEKLLLSIAGELLGRASIGRNDDLFALGFNSLSAMRLVARIERSLDIRVPLRTIYEAPTVAQLGRWLADAPRGRAASEQLVPIVLLNERGSRVPFFYFHNDLVADGVYCRRLARSFASAGPLYAVAPHGTAGLPVRYGLEEMAGDYLPRIRALQANGPYRLGGLCASGLVAYEVARLLRAQGEHVERLILINSWPLSQRAGVPIGRLIRAIATTRRLPLRLRENFCYNVEGLFDAAGAGPRGVSAFFVRRMRTMLRRALGVTRRVTNAEAFEKLPSANETETVIAHLVAPLTYRPEAYDGALTVLWSTDEAMPLDNARAMWQRLAKTTRTSVVAGDYRTLMQDGVENLGTALDVLLADTAAAAAFTGKPLHKRLEGDRDLFDADRASDAEKGERREYERTR